MRYARRLITQSGIIRCANGTRCNIKLLHAEPEQAYIVEVCDVTVLNVILSRTLTHYEYTSRFGSNTAAYEDAVEQFIRVRTIHLAAAA